METNKFIEELLKTNEALLAAYTRELEAVITLTEEIEELKKQIKKTK
jgi:hypothetical protein